MALQESRLQTGADIFVERHGFPLPSVYSDFASEYAAATTAVGVHDSSYMGRLKATGEDSLDLLNRLSTNKVVDLSAGEGAVTVLTTDRGRIIDVLGVVNQGGQVMLLTSPGRQQAVIEWLDKYTIMEDLTVEDVTSETTMLALVGPDAGKLLGLTSAQIPQDTLTVQSVQLAGIDVVVVEQPLGTLSRYWLIVSPEAALGLWQRLAETGAVPPGANATVTVCHSRTKNLARITQQADILIAAIGVPKFIKSRMVKQGVVIIDVGVNRVEDKTKRSGYRLEGDVDFKNVLKKAKAITPVPGGVGPMTITMLLQNTVESAKRTASARRKKK